MINNVPRFYHRIIACLGSIAAGCSASHVVNRSHPTPPFLQRFLLHEIPSSSHRARLPLRAMLTCLRALASCQEKHQPHTRTDLGKLHQAPDLSFWRHLPRSPFAQFLPVLMMLVLNFPFCLVLKTSSQRRKQAGYSAMTCPVR